MDEDVKARLEGLDKRLESTEKRIDDIKWFIGGITGLFTIVFGLITLLGNLNFSAEKAELRQFQRDLKAELGKVEAPPTIELYGANGRPLANQEVEARFERGENDASIRFDFSIRNSGESLSGPIYVKFYTSDPVRFWNKSTDEADFQYEAYITPKELNPSEIPGGYSTEYFLRFSLPRKETPPPGRYPALLKLFYGKGKVAEAPILIAVGRDAQQQ